MSTDASGRRETAGWTLINGELLPAAERGGRGIVLPSHARNIGILGAHRSGTTWLANLVGEAVEACRPFEKAGALHILGERSVPSGHDSYVWQGTFLVPCASLATRFAEGTFTVLILRDPADIVRSMVHNWAGLEDVVRLVERVSGTRPSGTPPERSIAVLGRSLEVIRRLFERQLIDAVTTFDALERDHLGEVRRICASAGLPVRQVPARQRAADLDPLATELRDLVEAQLGAAHRSLLALARQTAGLRSA